jgi:hypothetical protein
MEIAATRLSWYGAFLPPARGEFVTEASPIGRVSIRYPLESKRKSQTDRSGLLTQLARR